MSSRNERRKRKLEKLERYNKQLIEQDMMIRNYVYNLEIKYRLLQKEYDRYAMFVTLVLIFLSGLYVYLITL